MSTNKPFSSLDLGSLTDALEKHAPIFSPSFSKKGGLDLGMLAFGTSGLQQAASTAQTTTRPEPKPDAKKKCEVLTSLEQFGCPLLVEDTVMKSNGKSGTKLTRAQSKRKKKKKGSGAAYAEKRQSKAFRRQRKKSRRKTPY